MTRNADLTAALELLGAISKGKATLTVGGHPFVILDADQRTVEVEEGGVKAAGLHLWDLVKGGDGTLAGLAGPLRVARTLSGQGWKLSLSADGDRVLTMGNGVSRLSGHIGVNPLKAMKLGKALKYASRFSPSSRRSCRPKPSSRRQSGPSCG